MTLRGNEGEKFYVRRALKSQSHSFLLLLFRLVSPFIPTRVAPEEIYQNAYTHTAEWKRKKRFLFFNFVVIF